MIKLRLVWYFLIVFFKGLGFGINCQFRSQYIGKLLGRSFLFLVINFVVFVQRFKRSQLFFVGRDVRVRFSLGLWKEGFFLFVEFYLFRQVDRFNLGMFLQFIKFRGWVLVLKMCFETVVISVLLYIIRDKEIRFRVLRCFLVKIFRFCYQNLLRELRDVGEGWGELIYNEYLLCVGYFIYIVSFIFLKFL